MPTWRIKQLAIKAFISVPMLIFQSRVLGKKKERKTKTEQHAEVTLMMRKNWRTGLWMVTSRVCIAAEGRTFGFRVMIKLFNYLIAWS